jgi:hypothetical protein
MITIDFLCGRRRLTNICRFALTPRAVSLLLGIALVRLTFEPLTANSETASGGIVYGDKSAFLLSAPSGWVLDLKKSRELGVPALFRPSAGSSGTLCYAMVVGKSDDCQSIADYLALDLKKLSTSSGAKVTVRELPAITTRKGGQAKVYQYLGESSGRVEAVAYFETKDSIDVIIYSTKTEQQFRANFPAFQQLAQSYEGGLHVDHRVAQ